MAAALDLTVDWADGTHTFRLPIAQLEEHDEKCGAGPLTVALRLETGTWRLADVRETIRLGLIGGGAKPADASKLVKRYVDARPLIESVPLAVMVLAVALHGRQVDPEKSEGKPTPAKSESDPPPATDGSISPRSDATPASSASDPAISAG